jgi:hypothetical protein
MNPLPPRESAARVLAEASGSSGRGNGMRSMTTSRSEGPGTSTPCQSDSVPNRHVSSDSANSLTSCMVESSPWQSSGKGSLSRRAAAAALAARIEENSPSVRPPAASISSCSSSRYSGGRPSRPGSGRCLATYKMPLRPCANGDPTSIPVHSSPIASASRPHCRASGVNDPPRVSVADVRTTVRSANRCSASTSPTSSGATCRDGGRAVVSAQSSGRSSQTTSSRSSIGWSNAVTRRSAVAPISSSATSAVCAAPAVAGSPPPESVSVSGSKSEFFALATRRTCAAHAMAASRTTLSEAASAGSSESIRPDVVITSSGPSAFPASESRASSASSASRPHRRTASSTAVTDSSPLATDVTRSTSSWASSTITIRCSGRMPPSPSASMASSAWLVTTTSASAAIRRARSEKHWMPNWQRWLPMHSMAVTATWRQAWSGTPGTSSSRSPVVVELAQAWTRLTCAPSWLLGSKRASWPSSGVLRSLFRQR